MLLIRSLFLILLTSPMILAQAPTIHWLNDLDAATAQAQKLGRPLMIVFR